MVGLGPAAPQKVLLRVVVRAWKTLEKVEMSGGGGGLLLLVVVVDENWSWEAAEYAGGGSVDS